MKNIKYIIIAVLGLTLSSCIVDPELREVPKSSLGPENSYLTKAGFEAAVYALYDDAKSIHTEARLSQDMYADRESENYWVQSGINWQDLGSSSEEAVSLWAKFYSLIAKANTIIDRADWAKVSDWTEAEKEYIVAQARFFRGYAYLHLANIYGGVPLLLKETTSPKFDYVRASREETYMQAKADLEWAAARMKSSSEIQGGIAPAGAAYHYLAEANLGLGDNKAAIEAASVVIEKSGYSLMTSRFGVRKDYKFEGYDYTGEKEPWGDVYWDLFQDGNMCYVEGNKEAIWNDIYTYNQQGAGELEGVKTYSGKASSQNGDIRDLDNKPNWSTFENFAAQTGGYCFTDYTAFTIWQYKGDFDRDIRNNKFNMCRETYWNNPESRFYHQLITAQNTSTPGELYTATAPCAMKCIEAVPVSSGLPDPISGVIALRKVFKDWYALRLPETYFLRAEAYLKDGQKDKAAADINAVRNRAKATPVTVADVTIDLILDESARELISEGFRLSELCRLGKNAEYLEKYNNYLIQIGKKCPAAYNLLPIPDSEIRKNRDAVLEQNPGY